MSKEELFLKMAEEHREMLKNSKAGEVFVKKHFSQQSLNALTRLGEMLKMREGKDTAHNFFDEVLLLARVRTHLKLPILDGELFGLAIYHALKEAGVEETLSYIR